MKIPEYSIEKSIVSDYIRLKSAAKRLDEHLTMYTGWREMPDGSDAYTRARDEIHEIYAHVKLLETAIKDM